MKKIIIVGGSGSLGNNIILKLRSEFTGLSIINISRNEVKGIINIITDLTRNKDINHAIKNIQSKHKDADTLICCPGVLHRNKVLDLKPESIDEDFAVNSTGIIKIVSGIIPIIATNKGDIVIVGSTSSFVGTAESSVYCSAKHAVLGFIKSLQDEYKKEDVRIIGIHPGGFQGGFHIKANSPLEQSDLMDPQYLAGLIADILKLPRNMEVSEIIINRKKPR